MTIYLNSLMISSAGKSHKVMIMRNEKTRIFLTLMFTLALWISLVLIIACESDDDDDDEEEECDLGWCAPDNSGEECPTFEISCQTSKVTGCRIVNEAEGRGCCMNQKELEAFYCD